MVEEEILINQNNLTWQKRKVNIKDREEKLKQKGMVFWLTGLSGSGKSTIAVEVEKKLFDAGYLVYLLDGDNIRQGLNADLGFSIEDRKENLRRIAQVAALFKDAGFIVITSFISPLSEAREYARRIIGENSFVEVYIKASVEACQRRDPKRLYRKVENKEIGQFTGIDSPYEEPTNPDLIIDTEKCSIVEGTAELISSIKKFQEKNI